MGQAKKAWMEQQEEEFWEEKCDWIREQLDDYSADENTHGWAELSEEFDCWVESKILEGQLYEDEWSVVGKTRFQIFEETIEAARNIMESKLSSPYYKNLSVMVYAHIVAAVESYLSSTFIEVALSTDNHMQRLVESDPEFAKRKFTINEIFNKRKALRNDLQHYLKEMIFHNISKVRTMYASVLDIDFGEVEWLFKAVSLRHHCVHRAGYDKEGKKVDISKDTVTELMDKALEMISDIEADIVSMPEDGSFFWKDNL